MNLDMVEKGTSPKTPNRMESYRIKCTGGISGFAAIGAPGAEMPRRGRQKTRDDFPHVVDE
jgi:hypothetical protein